MNDADLISDGYACDIAFIQQFKGKNVSVIRKLQHCLKKNILYAELFPSATDSNLKLTVNIIIQ